MQIVKEFTLDNEEEREREEWRLGDYDNMGTGCPNCGRQRLCLCNNGKHRCEKCNYVVELGVYAPVSL
jgi:hypothetical protein